MRFHEIASGLRVPISGEEQAVLRLAKSGPLRRDDLDDRQQEVARQMVKRGVLERGRIDGNVVFIDTDSPVRRD